MFLSRLTRSAFFLILSSLFLSATLNATYADNDLFAEKVAPILKNRCLSCHNDEEAKGDFSVQNMQAAFEGGYIDPGLPDDSYLIELITPVDGQAEMPKNGSHLDEDEVIVIRKWIEEGAKWPEGFEFDSNEIADLDWWSLAPLRRPDVPKLDSEQNRDEIRRLPLRTPIDAFIQEKLTEKGLQPSAEADRKTLLRRLYFDLTGLPPTRDEVEDFVNDDSKDAYEKRVDQLLASPRYGERWARHWLDVAHYADTHGYDKDKPRPNAWPYRDYVIRSFNDDKPYSQFIMEQIAGDALWPERADGITATGFMAAGPWDFIGHVEVPESKIDGKVARNLDRDDMVSSTLNTFCSVTVQCARCHNHKFDPITQEHYYRLQAVFAALDRSDRSFDVKPAIAKKRKDLDRVQRELQTALNAIEREIRTAGGQALIDLDQRIAKLNSLPAKSSPGALRFGYHSAISQSASESKWVQIDLGQPTKIAKIQFAGCHDDFNGIGAGFGFPVRYKIEACNQTNFDGEVKLLVDQTDMDVANPGTELQEVKLSKVVEARYLRVTATKLAPRKGDFIFALAELMAFNEQGTNVALGATVRSLDSIEVPARWQMKNLVDGFFVGHQQTAKIREERSRLQHLRIELLNNVTSKRIRREQERLQRAMKQTQAEVKTLPPQNKVYSAMVYHGSGSFLGTGPRGGKPRSIHLLHRGDVQTPRQEVVPGTFPLREGEDGTFELSPEHRESDRRIALARWLADKENPLTWRSIANRIWQYHFGRGIVDTPNDFGRMGEQPTHPELLDWLACEFRDDGQSFKKLHRMIVLSSVYRQTSSDQEENSLVDGDNRFLWRMNRRRLSAEEIRDHVLFVAGKLDLKMYGPGYPLFVLENPEHSPHYEYDKHDPDDSASHRRSIYRFVVRSQPDPFMTTLDCADSSQSVAKRSETTTALQALSLLNNKFMLRMAEHLASRTKAESESFKVRVAIAFEWVTGRVPREEEREALENYANEYGFDNLCRMLLNLNEFVFID